MEHPLAMDAEAMRRAGYATVDALVARLADPKPIPCSATCPRTSSTTARSSLSLRVWPFLV